MMGRLSNSRLLRLFSSAVIDQAVLSAASLTVGLLLIRHTSDTDYGHFVLVQTALLLLVSLQGAFIGGPLSVLAPKRDAAGKREMVGGIFKLQRQFTTRAGVAGLLVVGLLAALQLLPLEYLAVWGAFVLAAWFALNREVLRQMLLIYTRPQMVLRADIVYVLVWVAIAAVAAFYTDPAAPLAVLGLAIAAWAGAMPAKASLASDPGFADADPRHYLAELAPLGLWATAGAAIYWTFSQGYNYLVALQLDVAAVAAVAATRLLLMPVNLLTGGVKQLLLPTASGWYRELGMASMFKRLLVFIAGVTALALCYCALLWLTRDWLTATVLKKQIAGRDTLILIWMGVFLIAMVRDLLITVLFVRERFSSLTWLALLCAIVALGVGTLLMPHYGAQGALVGLLLGEVLNICGASLLVWREVRRPVKA